MKRINYTEKAGLGGRIVYGLMAEAKAELVRCANVEASVREAHAQTIHYSSSNQVQKSKVSFNELAKLASVSTSVISARRTVPRFSIICPTK